MRTQVCLIVYMVQIGGVEMDSVAQNWPSVCYRCPARTNMQSADYGIRRCKPEIFGGQSRNRRGRYVQRPTDCPDLATSIKKTSETPEMMLKQLLKLS